MDSSNIEAIKNQERQIEREIADKIPFVSDKIPLLDLKGDYQFDDEIYQRKIERLASSYATLRRTRPDGNCFFRAFGFAYFESLLDHKDPTELERLINFTKESKNKLCVLGLPPVTIEDFYEVFLGVLCEIQTGDIKNTGQLLERFCTNATSDYIVVYLRLITSCHLQNNVETYSNFLVGITNMHEFCKTDVEPMYKESDHIHVVAITSALQVCTRIIYMDRGSSSDTANAHDFPHTDSSREPRVHLLYRPGHYDILYKRSDF